MNDLPGYDKATELGYTLHHYSGDRKQASYLKDGVTLTVRRTPTSVYGYDELKAELWAVLGLVELRVSDFQFPHPRFEMLEKQIRTVLNVCNAESEAERNAA